MEKLSLGGRMKEYYEEVWKIKLPMRMPAIIRLDGRAFHSLTKQMDKPFDEKFIKDMQEVAVKLCENIDGAQLAYIQSDEISILMHNYKKLSSQAWFGNELQKLVSISASIASSHMSLRMNTPVQFDSRIFVLPEAEVCNYFIWRQQDWTRNSVQMLARSLYSHNECYYKNNSELQEMCFEKGHNWNDLPDSLKRGTCVIKAKAYNLDFTKWVTHDHIPIFTKNREFIEQWLKIEEE